MPSEFCSNDNCDQLEQFLPSDVPVEILGCNFTCCQEDLCNAVPDSLIEIIETREGD